MTNGSFNVMWPGWEVVRKIGSGSFGTVYEIQREVYGDIEKAALKVIVIPHSEDEVDYLRCTGLDDASITNTFHQQVGDIAKEYKLMAQMRDNPNVVRCDDFRDIQHDDGLGWDIYIKMELLTPLMKSLDKVSTEEQIIRLAKDICNALITCQDKNIIHRDIKPQNVFIADNGHFKLGDFGIARTIERTTHATAGIGTYSYMAPEIEKNEPYGKTADIYSLGLMVYWLLNERRAPFMPLPPDTPKYGDEEKARQRRFAGEAIPAPKNGSDEFKTVVLKACAYNPADRYQTAQEMMNALCLVGGKDQIPQPIAPIDTESHSKNISETTLDYESDADTYDDKTVGINWANTKVSEAAFEEITHNEWEDDATVGPTFVDKADESQVADSEDLAGVNKESNEDKVEVEADKLTEDDGLVDNKSQKERSDEDDLINICDWRTVNHFQNTLNDTNGNCDIIKEKTNELETKNGATKSAKFIAIIAVVLLLSAVGLISAISSKHRCEYTIKKSDTIKHWFECSCGEKSAIANHIYGDWTIAPTNSVRTCTVCGYTQIHSHNYTVDYDEERHWEICSCGQKTNPSKHIYSEWEITKSASCSFSGTKKRQCYDCSYEEEQQILATGIHSFGSWVVVKAATATSTGTQERTCTICKTYKQTETIPVTHSHSYTSVWISDYYYHWHSCSCGATTGMNTHNVGSWSVTTAATCYSTGTQSRKCITCSYIQTQTIPQEAHTEKTRSAVEATCTSSGLTAGKYCSVCGVTTVSQSTVPAKGHNYVSGKCTRCGELNFSTGLSFSSNGDGTYSVSGIGSCTDKNVVIPPTFNGKAITSIANHAFNKCDFLESVLLPDSIRSIGDYAFHYCYRLSYVSISYGVESIGVYAFSNCALENVSLPDSITYIGNGAFFKCEKLRTVKLPNGLTSIETALFLECSQLKSIEMPRSLTEIGPYAFEQCSNLANITIPSNVSFIASYAFWNCSALTNVYFENPNSCWYRALQYQPGHVSEYMIGRIQNPSDGADAIKKWYEYYWYLK